MQQRLTTSAEWENLSDLSIIIITINIWMVRTLLMPNDGIGDDDDYDE